MGQFFKQLISNLLYHWLLSIFTVILLVVLGIVIYLNFLFSKVQGSLPDGNRLSIWSFVEAAGTNIKGEDTGRTNIILYGLTADESRTDSILLISYYWKEKKLVTVNVPRDLYINYKDYKGKMVSLYEVEKANNPGNKNLPADVVDKFIGDEFKVPIDYHFVNNFDSLKQTVNTLGGITVTVDRSFSDPFYPNDNFGYIVPPPHFNAGAQVLNGDQALIFSRSRQSQDQPLEGTDFARSQRQQKVIAAIMDKVKKQSYFTDVTQLGSFLEILGRDMTTNMKSNEIIKLAFVFRSLNLSQDYLKANWSNDSGFFCDSQADDQYVLRYGNADDCLAIAGTDSSSPYRQQAIDYIQNLLTKAK